MAHRQAIKPFVPKENSREVKNNEATERKFVWSPPPSVETLVSKVNGLEERLDHLETTISGHLDLEVKRQEQKEVEQSRRELKEMRDQLDEAVQKLRQREEELQGTLETVDNLSNQTALDREQIYALQADKKKLQQMVHDMEIKLNERLQKIQRLEKQVKDLQRTVKDTTNKLASVQKNQQTQDQQMQQMQQQINSIIAGAGQTAKQSARAESPREGNLVSSRPGASGHGCPQGDRGTASPKQQLGALELPPIPLRSSPTGSPGGRTSSSGSDAGVKMNFPPK